jgi:trehalose 6-phosphate synthase
VLTVGRGAQATGNNQIQFEDHRAHVGVFVVGIDPQKFDDALKDEGVIKRIQELDEEYKDKIVIVGVDRLDYTKGLVQKLQGFEEFLKENPELAKKVVLIQVAVPSREDVKEYQELEKEISTLVGKICGTYGKFCRSVRNCIADRPATPEGVPLIYIHRSVSFPELTALYCVAKACLITSRRDGMNLVASEYVACQEGRYGVLVLSELAGAASFMGHGSVTFHPSSTRELADAIQQAVTMDYEEKKRRYKELSEFVTTHTR